MPIWEFLVALGVVTALGVVAALAADSLTVADALRRTIRRLRRWWEEHKRE